MYIQLKLSVPQKENRQLAKIQVCAKERELEALQAKGITALCCKTPIPIQLYTHETPQVKSIRGITFDNEKPWKGFFLPKAPKVGMNRPIPRKTAMSLPLTNSEITLGWINPKETQILLKWWETVKEEFMCIQIKEEEKPKGTETQFFHPSSSSNKEINPEKQEAVKASISKRRGLQILD